MDSSAFRGLYIKEWKMMKGFYIGQFIVALIFVIAADAMSGASIFESLVGLLTFGFIILPGAVLFSLNTESNQLEIFLHNPQSIHKMLFVKFLNGLFFSLSFLIILAVVAVCFEMIWGASIQSGLDSFSLLIFLIVHMMVVSVYPTVILVFLWTLHQIWRTYIHGLSIVAVVLLLIVGIQLMSLFRSTTFYEVLTKWGVIFIPDERSGDYLSISFGLGEISGGVDARIFFGSYVFYGLLVLLLYGVSAYLLDRKVEV
ncbi:hypothetical protein SAMN05216232_1501 [Virgibacillus subterraneus]|uniref:ABC transporter permease n=1 Tax=Virgibacillus subterraneus TaxID=621109 RepID=A0A1H9C978_9BACI|nr:hypothetical protein [Virgibacillus subterraneus]SEP97704.1 hypothetical protein SAMN05216232_1501 [Virgibacillus subterraneus]